MVNGPSSSASVRTGARPPLNDAVFDGTSGGSWIRFSAAVTPERYRALVEPGAALWQT